ncbi:glycoside hydrolase family 13 protein [Angelakisella massiliensis]|uniref:glycoside hydrolase family 13 protein n=1 Tax=Angelakisella massiliensis TaxID=1871018 RepID=UPI0008F8ABB3|nr:glycoside hydrolase family 13 protein [Angelakisella massiliensis]
MIFCSRNEFHKSPFGAVPAGTAVSFRLTFPHNTPDPKAVLEVFQDDVFDVPALVTPFVFESRAEGFDSYICEFTPSSPQLLFYRFSILSGGNRRILGRDAGGSGSFESKDLWQLTVYDPGFQTPPELAGAVFYQIFPDRFCNSGKPKKNVPSDRILHKDWYEEPVSRPNAQGEFLCNDYFGGDLEGIRQKLPYLAELGVEVLYLNPIFEAHSNHRYNTADYSRVDPLLGENEDFRQLCADAEKLGIRVMLDGVFNHTGSDSVYFNKEGRYGHTGAYQDPNSPYRSWFSWEQYPTRYQSWWGFETLPNVNEECDSYRDFICGEQGVLRSWLRAGAKGFRLDVADELPDSFIQDIRKAVKEEDPHNLLLGEVWEDASNKISYGCRRQYFQGRELDSVMNYPWRTAILNFIRYGAGDELREAIETILENYPAPVIPVLMNCLSTHDVPRAITALAAPPMDGHDREWQRQHNTLDANTFYTGRQMLLLAAMIQYTLPGAPCLYYGDEAGLVGYADPFNRGTYPWGREDVGLVDFFRILGSLHKKSPTLRTGSFEAVSFDHHSCTYLRRLENHTLLVCVNRSREDLEIPYDPWLLRDAEPLLTVGGMEDCFSLHGHSAILMRLPDGEKAAKSFFVTTGHQSKE